MTDIPTRLAALREPAPAHLLPEVLARAGLTDRYAVLPSPLGPVFVAFTGRGVSLVDLAGDPARFEAAYRARFGREVVAAEALPARLAAAVDRALASGRTRGVPVDLSGLSEFQVAVLHLAAEIPPGEVRPYGWVAREIGRPGSDRAVGNALAANPVPLVVPCHRVVRADGRFGRYSLGDDENKRVLLEAEGLEVEEYEAVAGRGVRYVGSDTTGTYCHPTCRHARRITAAHRVEFSSSAEAARAGFRPCRDCRPMAA
jgi:O-6-methylguanine DNA methyltransferase